MPPDDFTFDKPTLLAMLDAGFRTIPHNAALELRVVDCGKSFIVVELPWAEHLVGNPETGGLHGGAITSLLDATCGGAIFMHARVPVPIATLDLRIDYLKPATARRSVFARAECYRLGRSVAFVRASAYQDAADPIASAAATFMRTTRGRSAFDAPPAGPRSGVDS